MPISISIDKKIHRFDAPNPPVITTAGITNTGRIKVNDWQYLSAGNSAQNYLPLNRTQKSVSFAVRNVFRPTWTRDANIALNSTNDLVRTTGTGYAGAVYPTALNAVRCSIEALRSQDSLTLISGVSLQSGTVYHDYYNVGVEHAILLGEKYTGAVVEFGVTKTTFKYIAGDTVIIEQDSGVVRYYIKHANNTLRLIRTTRSKLSGAIYAEVMLYNATAELNNIFVFDGEQAKTTMELVGVLENFQDWRNEGAVASTADVVQLANNSSRSTYSSNKKYLRTLNATRNNANKDAFRDPFIAFYEFHLLDREFLFVDKARKEEFWARFASPFGDKTGNGCVFSNNAAIIEDLRTDYVGIEGDVAIGGVDATIPSTPTNFTAILLNSGGSAPVLPNSIFFGDAQVSFDTQNLEF